MKINFFTLGKFSKSEKLKNSVYRRTFLHAAIIAPGFLANYLIYFFSERLLLREDFGNFYVALTIGNILFSASLVLNLFFSKYLVRVAYINSESSVFFVIQKIEKIVILIGFIISCLLFLVFLYFSFLIGVQSKFIIFLIILEAYTSYIADLGRVFFQVIDRPISLGIYTTVWLLLRFILCITFLWVFKTVWAGMLGIVISAAIIYSCFRVWVNLHKQEKCKIILPKLSPANLVITSIGYGLLVIVSNMDVLAAYILLLPNQLSIYSSSSIFTKAIPILITPLLQMLFPMIIGTGDFPLDLKINIKKIIGVTLLFSLSAIIFINFFSNKFCGNQWGLILCNELTLQILSFSVIPITLLRVIVIIQLARTHEKFTGWLILPIIFYSILLNYFEHTLLGISQAYVTISIFTLLLYSCIYVVSVNYIDQVVLKKNS